MELIGPTFGIDQDKPTSNSMERIVDNVLVAHNRGNYEDKTIVHADVGRTSVRYGVSG